MTTTKDTAPRKGDPDRMRITAVKLAGKKLRAAEAAVDTAGRRAGDAGRALDALLNAAPPAQRAYLRSVAGLPVEGE